MVDEQANAVPFVPEHEIVTTLGDTWLLGKHKIICFMLRYEVFLLYSF